MKLKTQRQYLVDVEGCARCGQDHTGNQNEGGRGRLLFKPFQNPEGRDDLWTFCPETGEPLLISSEDID